MSLLRALRAYVGLGPDDGYEGEYLRDLDPAEPTIDLTESSTPTSRSGSAGSSRPGNNAYKAASADELARLGFDRIEKPSNGAGNGAHAKRAADAHRAEEHRAEATEAELRAEFADEQQTSVDNQQDADQQQGHAVVHSLDSIRTKPKTIVPETFSDAKLVADEFKLNVPVVLNLQGSDRELARRLIDFTSGLCYALDGSMEKIASQVFLVTPDGIAIDDEDRDKIKQRGYAR